MRVKLALPVFKTCLVKVMTTKHHQTTTKRIVMIIIGVSVLGGPTSQSSISHVSTCIGRDGTVNTQDFLLLLRWIEEILLQQSSMTSSILQSAGQSSLID